MNRCLLSGIMLVMMIGYPVYADTPLGCEGRIPDYILEGSEGMVLTEEAEKVLCREDGDREIWDGRIADGGVKTVVEDKLVLSALVRKSLEGGSGVEFRDCVLPEELYIRGNVKGNIFFDRCEFRGNFDIHDAQFDGELRINRSVLHQGIHVADSNFLQPFKLYGSMIAGDLLVDNSNFSGGIRVSGTRLSGSLVANGLQSPVGVSFAESRFLGSLNMTGLEVGGGVRFRECEWSERSLLNFTKGTIAGGLRFDACGFESNWKDVGKSGVALVRLADLTVSSSIVLADAKSKRFPTVRVSRCLIPFIKLPEWSIAKEMVMLDKGELSSERELEDSGELLQLVRKSYEAQGRTRDAGAARNAHRLLIARIKGQPVLGLRLALSYFGTGIWWFSGVVLLFAVIFFAFGRRWRLVTVEDRLALVAYRALDLSLRGLIKGPPEEGELAARMAPEAKKCMILERICGMVLFFLLGLALKELLEG